MSGKPLNCWEFKQCGREPGGENVDARGICPVATEKSMDGIHRGDNAGRVCWVVAGSYSGGEAQGHFASQLTSCTECDFFNAVLNEENTDVQETTVLLDAMQLVTR